MRAPPKISTYNKSEKLDPGLFSDAVDYFDQLKQTLRWTEPKVLFEKYDSALAIAHIFLKQLIEFADKKEDERLQKDLLEEAADYVGVIREGLKFIYAQLGSYSKIDMRKDIRALVNTLGSLVREYRRVRS